MLDCICFKAFVNDHKNVILITSTVVALIATVALAVLCFPTVFGCIGAWVVAHNISLVLLPMAAKVAVMAIPIVLELGLALAIWCLKPLAIEYTEVIDNIDQDNDRFNEKESVVSNNSVIQKDNFCKILDCVAVDGAPFQLRKKYFCSIDAMNGVEDKEIPSEFWIQRGSELDPKNYHIVNYMLYLIGSPPNVDEKKDVTSIRDLFGEEVSQDTLANYLAMIGLSDGLAADFMAMCWNSTNQELSRWVYSSAFTSEIRRDYRCYYLYCMLTKARNETSAQVLELLKENEAWQPDLWKGRFPNAGEFTVSLSSSEHAKDLQTLEEEFALFNNEEDKSSLHI